MHTQQNDFYEFEKLIGYRFGNISLLKEALTHSSFVNENQSLGYHDNERLEFLGDAVLQLCISEIIYKKFPDHDEGSLSKMRASLVTEQPLAEVSRKLNVSKWLHLGKGESTSGGREKNSILANALEAIIAAVFLDGGYAEVKAVVSSIFDSLFFEQPYRDTKSLLQEFCQARYKLIPQYAMIQEYGPDHDKTFEIEVIVNNHTRQRGIGKNKKEAEQNAATKALKILSAE
ncbi:MAG: ribonuclease III [Syntrophales bacterium]|jgi:ribonuclease III|nr:ribonuclease III [Syntrophales bacterium]MDY0044022.1 ribonuclease III [Syntrophales bacterium]